MCVSGEELWVKPEPGLCNHLALSLLPGSCIMDGRKVFEISQQEIVHHHSQKIQGRNLWIVM